MGKPPSTSALMDFFPDDRGGRDESPPLWSQPSLTGNRLNVHMPPVDRALFRWWHCHPYRKDGMQHLWLKQIRDKDSAIETGKEIGETRWSKPTKLGFGWAEKMAVTNSQTGVNNQHKGVFEKLERVSHRFSRNSLCSFGTVKIGCKEPSHKLKKNK